MTGILSTLEVIDSLALSIYDPSTELLREVEERDLVVPVFTGKSYIKRFYLIGEYLYKHDVKVTVNIGNTEYNAKVIIGRDQVRLSDFSEYTNSQETSYKDAPYKLLNALPVDVLVTSLGLSTEDADIEIEIEVLS